MDERDWLAGASRSTGAPAQRAPDGIEGRGPTTLLPAFQRAGRCRLHLPGETIQS
jgi:hypothetical protein